MCFGCYEGYGSPAIVNERTVAVADLVARIYDFAPAGGMCHVVLDDFNIEDEHIDWCIAYIQNPKERAGWDYDDWQAAVQLDCMLKMKDMTEEERASALAIFEGWVEVPA